jgi:phosphatidyl-myo-inositol dimannoside synthase
MTTATDSGRGCLPRLLLLTLTYPPPVIGGSYRYLWNLLRFLPPDSPLVILSQDAPSELTREADARHRGVIERLAIGGRSQSWRGLSKLWRTLPWLRHALRAARTHRSEVVIADFVTHSGMAAYLVSLLRHIPLVVVLYGEELSVSRHYRHPLKRWAKHLFLRTILRRARGVLGISDFTMDLARYFGARAEACHKIRPPVGEDLAQRGEMPTRYREWRARHDPVLLQTGRVVERKGHRPVIACLPELRQRFPRLGHVIVGTGEMEAELQQQVADLGLQEAVYFSGHVSEAELAGHYHDADLFVMPHLRLPNGDTEGCGTVFLEANLHGLAVVGGDAGGVRDAIIDGVTGLVVAADVGDELRDALALLLGDPERRRQMGEAGRQRVLAEFRAQDASAQFAQWCAKLVASGRRKP